MTMMMMLMMMMMMRWTQRATTTTPTTMRTTSARFVWRRNRESATIHAAPLRNEAKIGTQNHRKKNQ